MQTELATTSGSGRGGLPAVRGSAPARSDDEETAGYLPVEKLRKRCENYYFGKIAEIEEQKESRRYYHGAHWGAKEIEILRERNQPVISTSLLARKINGIVGLIAARRQDPKAYPRTPKNEEGAEVATASVRYVLDRNDWKTLENNCLLQAGVEGIAGVELKLVAGDHGDPDIALAKVDGEDFFYSSRSHQPDFSDSHDMGIAKWTDLDDAVELFPDKEDDLRQLVESGSDLSSNSDREFRWLVAKENRIRLVEHWYRHRGEWCFAFYVATTLLMEGKSPFLDENRKTMCRFAMFSAAVDHDGDRYGFVRNLKSVTDETNQRRSKALHLSNSRQVEVSKGAVDDVETLRRERARADGVIEKNPGGEIVYLDNTPAIVQQFQFLEDSKNELQSFANTDLAQSLGPSARNLSGRAVSLLQAPGMAELGPFVTNFRGWKLRIYRAVWNMAQQYWTAERWIRITDDEDVAKFLQINGVDLDDYGEPVLVNALGSLDVDIIIDEGPDVPNMMADAFDVLAQRPDIPLPILVELMQVNGSIKRKIQALMQQSTDPAQQIAKKIALEQGAAEVEKTKADTHQKEAKADELRAKAVVDGARAAHLAHEANLNAAEFGLRAAHEAAATPEQPQQPQQQQGPPPGAPGMPPPPPSPMRPPGP